jgi:putative aldouronate transport system substrate-binding protein
MQKKSKRFAAISAITALGLLISAGCSSQTATNDKGSGQSSSNKRLKLSMMYPLYSDPPQKAEVWKFVEDKFNIELDPMAVPSNSYTEKQKVITASGDMPDAMVWTTFPDPEFVKMVKQGAFLALDDLIKTAPNIQKTPQGIWDNIKIDGKIYGIPRPRALTRAAVMIRKDWLDNVGLPIPKTTDEIYQTALKFTTMDPDKNGKNDTFGIALGENLSRLESFWMACDYGRRHLNGRQHNTRQKRSA